uniref:ubiquitinyl hydrolase 1 n=1 Tax=Bos taurus TaxID=9913 RepID=A0AAA9TLW8_BOVIN
MGREGAGSSCGARVPTSRWQCALPWALAGHIFTGSLRDFKCRLCGAESVDEGRGGGLGSTWFFVGLRLVEELLGLCGQSETSFNLISEKCDILSILRDHPENRIYQRKIQELSKRFTAIRKTKGDGNCFYRALGYSYLESLLGKSREILKFKERVLQTPNDLLVAGFEEHTFRNFFNAFYSVVELVEKDGSVSSLLKVFNDQSFSDRIVQFLRLLTSAFIRNRADFFRHFIDEEMDIKDFCAHEVEPMAMECDHIQITALSQALNIALQVEYVDEMDTALNHHVFPEAATPSVYLLYKTSHYNILYAADKH